MLTKAEHLEEHVKALEKEKTLSEEERSLLMKDCEDQNAKVEKLEKELQTKMQQIKEMTKEIQVILIDYRHHIVM